MTSILALYCLTSTSFACGRVAPSAPQNEHEQYSVRPDDASAEASDAEQTMSDIVLEAPHIDPFDDTMADRLPAAPRVDTWKKSEASEQLLASAFQFNAPIFSKSDRTSLPAGLSRRGNIVPVETVVGSGQGCKGKWYRVRGSGYVCEDHGFFIDTNAKSLPEQYWTPAAHVDQPLPYDYAVIVETGSPIFWRIPQKSELKTVLAGGESKSLRERSVAHHWVAIAKRLKSHGYEMVKTVRGYYMLAEHVKPVESSQFSPVMFDDSALGVAPSELGTAIVLTADAPVRRAKTDQVIGKAERYARFPIAQAINVEGQAQVCDANDRCVAEKDVRKFIVATPPEDVQGDAQWIHVDLRQQVLTAYEGTKPKMATLISSGRGEFSTPLGTFYVHKKFHTRTMSGGDTPEGMYYVGQVPWTLYFWQSFAIHGAYWHDGFGHTKSHGCVNVPPIAARWLFAWADPILPEGWHGKVGAKGPIVHVTGKAPPHPDDIP